MNEEQISKIMISKRESDSKIGNQNKKSKPKAQESQKNNQLKEVITSEDNLGSEDDNELKDKIEYNMPKPGPHAKVSQ